MGGMNPTNRADLTIKPPSLTNVPKSIPRNVAAKIAWDSVKITTTITGSSTLTETNYSFSLGDHPQFSNWQQLFDQWSIPQFSVEFDSNVPPGATFIPPTLYTALDFDNSTSIGSIQSIEDFATCEYRVMGTGIRHLRSIRPSAKLSAANKGGGVSSSGLPGPMWIDAASTATQFGNVRSILGVSPYTTLNVTCTVWYCFKNQI